MCKRKSATEPCRTCHVAKGAEPSPHLTQSCTRRLSVRCEKRQTALFNQGDAPRDAGRAAARGAPQHISLVLLDRGLHAYTTSSVLSCCALGRQTSSSARVKMDAEQVCRAVQLLSFALSWEKDRIFDWLEP